MAVLKWSLRLVGGGLLVIALPFFIITLASLLEPNPSRDDRGAAWGGLLLGGPPAVAGIALVLLAQRLGPQGKKSSGDTLRQQFFDVLEAQDHRITVLQWSRVTGLSGQAAQAFLDERAKEFDATFDVGEAGQVVYVFPR